MIIIAFLTGYSTLACQIIWMRMLALTFGSTNAAVAVVVAMFMAGIGLGGLYFGRRADRVHSRLRFFGMLQLAAAPASFILYLVLRHLPFLFRTMAGSLGTDTSLVVLGIFAAGLMLIPTTLMGSAVPVLTRIWAQRHTIGRSVGIIYASNTLGSVAGAGLTGFFLIRGTGQSVALLIAVATLAITGFIAWLSSAARRVNGQQRGDAQNTPRSMVILLISGLTGFAALALEILWTRILHIFVANSTYGFTSVLIVFLTGIVLGSLLYARYLASRRSHITLLSGCLAGIGGCVLIAVIGLNDLPGVLFHLAGLLNIPSLRLVLPAVLLAGILAFAPTVIMGIVFPLLCTMYAQEVQRAGKDIGVVYSTNTLGSIIGSLCAGFVLIPVFGTVISITVIACLYVVMALLIYILRSHHTARIRMLTGMAVIVIAILLVWHAAQNAMILPPSLLRTSEQEGAILFYEETREGTVIVHEDARTSIRACYINNSAVCGTTYDALRVVNMLGHLPFLIRPQAHNALVVGFGTGVTAGAVAEHDLQHIDCVEICPGVRDAAVFFERYNQNITDDPRVSFIDGDARTYVLAAQEKYDVISCDPTHPTLGCNNLYTQEYFVLCKSILEQDYVICQYLPLHRVTLDEFRSLIRTFSSVFPHTTVWLGLSHCIMVGTPAPLRIDFSGMQRHLTDLQNDILEDPYDLAISLILDEDAVKRFAQDARLNTDAFPVLEFHSPHSLDRENWGTNLYELMKARVEPGSVFLNVADTVLLHRYLTAQRYFLSAMIYKNRGDLDKMLQSLRIAAQINPENAGISRYLEHELRQLGY